MVDSQVFRCYNNDIAENNQEHKMAVTVKQIREALNYSVDTIGKNKAGAIVVRKGFFYRNGMSSEKFTARVSELLKAAGIEFTVMRDGEHYAAFRGGASVATQSHWYVEIV